MRKIVVAGSVIVDKIHEIDVYPKESQLTQIRRTSRALGGLVPNAGRDIRILDPSVPVLAFGRVGDDDDGRFARAELEARGIDAADIRMDASAGTSTTVVMSVPGGERTFFVYPGAGDNWGYDDFPFARIGPGDIILLGYFLLLKRIDAGDGLRILKELVRRGAKTAVDLVTEDSDRYPLVRACLPFVDYLIVNEVEAARIAGLPADDDRRAIAAALLDEGVRERVVIHEPMRGVTLAKDGRYAEVRSFRLPEGFVKGKTGAGDAFCAGALLSIYQGLSDEEILANGATAAVGSLSAPGATEGMKTLGELKEMVKCW